MSDELIRELSRWVLGPLLGLSAAAIGAWWMEKKEEE